MEHELRSNLLACAEIFASNKQIGLSTLGRIAAGDWRFFNNLSADDKTFTARKYDEVLAWFSSHWPESAAWPAGVIRPEPARAAS
jgi:hypothetical protein